MRKLVATRDFESERKERKVKQKAIAWGKGKAVRDTVVLERRERQRTATNYQDLGARRRIPIRAKHYQSQEEFLQLAETSDEEEEK